MKRRDFVREIGLAAASAAMPLTRQLLAGEPRSGRWRIFEVETRVEVLKPAGTTRIWLPMALIRRTPYQRTISNIAHGKRGTMKTFETRSAPLGMVAAEFPAGVRPLLAVTRRVATRDWAVDLSAPERNAASSP
ncbi:MAG TPA: hypothetical protein VJ732_13670, partial [Bryobacteraceae bacterium]|nr:hypothetical protein [Bryobacteraceae bacterium]